ncbi:phosphoribosylglycinamide formyltransferase [Pseudogemmatithrix spongiicola]|uniref:Phosphoribosylglycinamide formyltransferase n=1 Tax=Pseudogemmatithrix spongiicola TaxID=3062599 RepID=A0AA49JTK9_9BACT|nr:phosphoribosylglycinamide formyltransferase [Gemmatimonadaceae bacterium 'strain 138']WKW14725.1 phosphoribosylglycinamide formyltransferase [Gemmatimonadaceae bacterium 'strain 318']
MTTPRARLAVLASGSGSNLQAIRDDLVARGAAASADLALVVSDRRAAGALERARGWTIPAVHLPKDEGATLDRLLREHAITHIALAGYLQLIPPDVVRRFHGRMLNVHPALLPAFGGPGMYGARVHAAVLAAGARVSGPTVHFVSEHYDEGAIVAQWPVPVRSTDTPESLGARVLAAEHKLYPWSIHLLTSGSLTLGPDGRVHGVPDIDFDRELP